MLLHFSLVESRKIKKENDGKNKIPDEKRMKKDEKFDLRSVHELMTNDLDF